MPSVSGTPNYRRILMREGAGFLLRRRRVPRAMVVLPRFRGRPALRPAGQRGDQRAADRADAGRGAQYDPG
jgi:hypothetical protein